MFIRLCETYGRNDNQSISAGFLNKSPEEIKKYSDVFWKKWALIESGQKYVDRIEKGELEIEKYRSIQEAIQIKYDMIQNDYTAAHPEDPEMKLLSVDDIILMKLPPLTDKKSILAMQPPPNPLFDFSQDEDRFLTYGIFRYGYG